MKKILLIIIIILLCGCSKYEELNNLAIISNIAISYKDNKYTIIMQEIIPKASDKKLDYKYKYHKSISNDLEKSFNKIIKNNPERIYLKKVQNIIIDDNQKEYIIKSLKKYYIKKKNINKNTSVVITNSNIHDVLKINSDYEYINSVLKNKIFLLKKIKNKKIKVPIIKIRTKELFFYDYSILHV